MAHQEFDPSTLARRARRATRSRSRPRDGRVPLPGADRRRGHRGDRCGSPRAHRCSGPRGATGPGTRKLSTKAGDVATQDPEAPQGQLLPLDPRAPAAHRPGPLRRGHGGLRPRGLDEEGRRPGGGPGHRAGISKSEVSRICAEMDEELEAFRHGPSPTSSSPTSSWTPPTSRAGSTTRWSPGPSSWPRG